MVYFGEICRCFDEERKNVNFNDGFICMLELEFRDVDVNGEILLNIFNLVRYIIIFI